MWIRCLTQKNNLTSNSLWPFLGWLSDLQLWEEKVTLNHLVTVFFLLLKRRLKCYCTISLTLKYIKTHPPSPKKGIRGTTRKQTGDSQFKRRETQKVHVERSFTWLVFLKNSQMGCKSKSRTFIDFVYPFTNHLLNPYIVCLQAVLISKDVLSLFSFGDFGEDISHLIATTYVSPNKFTNSKKWDSGINKKKIHSCNHLNCKVKRTENLENLP